MFNEKIDYINENRSFFLLENNDTFDYNGNILQNLNNTVI